MTASFRSGMNSSMGSWRMAESSPQGPAQAAPEGSRSRVPSLLRPLAHRVRDGLTETVAVCRDTRRWMAIMRTPPARTEVRVSYGYERMPGIDAVVYGGLVKFQMLSETFQNAPRDFNVLYLGSTSLPLEARALVALARRRQAAFVWNQNGVCYPGWFGAGCERLNRPRARLLHAADYVIYQSAFCKISADRFYGERHDRWEVLHNPVDTERFRPSERPVNRPPTLLLGGNQYQRYRMETALHALAELRREVRDARMIVAGAVAWHPDRARARRETERLVTMLDLDDAVEFSGPYSRAEAPALMQRADVLVHTKYNDPCPSVVLEAMASGLPVVYSGSGGVPELVGDAGFAVPAPLDFERDHPPDPQELASATAAALARLPELSAAARLRAVERFDLRKWSVRHRELFEELTCS